MKRCQSQQEKNMTQKISFEASMLRLTEIISALEKNEIDLETSITLFEEGLHLVKACDGQLKNFEDKVQTLMTQYDNNNKAE